MPQIKAPTTYMYIPSKPAPAITYINTNSTKANTTSNTISPNAACLSNVKQVSQRLA